jgi:sec-independent protein translocase protein TatA
MRRLDFRAARRAFWPKGFVMSLGPTELLIVFAIVMLLFGATKLPKLARSLGESAKEFKSAQTAIDSVNEPQETKS